MQFSVRTLLISMTLCAVAAGLGSAWNRSQRQKRLVALLTEEKDWYGEPRNKIIYDFQRSDRYQRLPPHAPKWLVNALGIDCFANVVGFESHVIPRKQVLDDTALMTILRDFPQLQRLSLFMCVRNDRDLGFIRRHDQLRDLQVTFSKVNGTGLRGMNCRDRLRVLSLHGCPVSDEGLDVIAGFPRLEELDLSVGNGGVFEPHFSHFGLANLAKLNRLKILQLGGLDATDADLAAIAKIRSLERLELSEFPFTAATGTGIRKLSALTQLRSLRLNGDMESEIPRGKLPLVLDALADAQDAKDWREFQRAKAGWERPAAEDAVE